MQPNPWIDRILKALATEQQKSEDAQLTGIEYEALLQALDVEQGSLDAMGVEDALQNQLPGYVELTTYDGLSLTDAGWQRVIGKVPGSENDEPFLQAAVALFVERSREQGHTGPVFAGDVAQRLGWQKNVEQLFNITRRLYEHGDLQARELAGDDVLFTPSYGAVQRFSPTQ